MQTMTSTSCDTDVAELPWCRRRTGPGKDAYITPGAMRKFVIGKIRARPQLLAEHFLRSVNSGRTCFALPGHQSGLAGGAAGRSGRGQSSAAHGNRSGGRVNRPESACLGVLLDGSEFLPSRIRQHLATALGSALGEADAYVTQS